jgi:PilZ domain
MKSLTVEIVPQKNKQAESSNGENARRFQRHSCKERPLVRLVAGPEGQFIQAVVRDVSREGIGLILLRHFELGSLLEIQFQFNQGPRLVISAEVKHAEKQLDGSWHLGFHMSRAFSDDELSDLLSYFPASESKFS